MSQKAKTAMSFLPLVFVDSSNVCAEIFARVCKEYITLGASFLPLPYSREVKLIIVLNPALQLHHRLIVAKRVSALRHHKRTKWSGQSTNDHQRNVQLPPDKISPVQFYIWSMVGAFGPNETPGGKLQKLGSCKICDISVVHKIDNSRSHTTGNLNSQSLRVVSKFAKSAENTRMCPSQP